MLVERDVVYVFDAFLRKSFFIFVNRFSVAGGDAMLSLCCFRFGVSVINVKS